MRVPPVGAAGLIVTEVHGTDTIVALSPDRGGILWRVDPPDPPAPPSSREHALDLAWLAPEGERVHAFYNVWRFIPGKFRLGAKNTGIVALEIDAASGEILRTQHIDAGIGGRPSNLSNSLLAVIRSEGLTGGRLTLMNLEDGSVTWEKKFRRLSHLPPRISGGRVWVALPGGQIQGISIETGEVDRTLELDASLMTPLRFAGGGIVAGTAKGRIVSLDIETRPGLFSSRCKLPFRWYHPSSIPSIVSWSRSGGSRA